MIGVILKGTNSSFQKGITFCCSIYMKNAMKLLAFIFEQSSYFHLSFLETDLHYSLYLLHFGFVFQA